MSTNRMALFTIIMELAGGTYISQVRADDVWSALLTWPAQLNVREIKGLGEKMRQRIIRELNQEPDLNQPVPLNSLANAWFSELLVRGKMMYINIIKTAEE